MDESEKTIAGILCIAAFILGFGLGKNSPDHEKIEKEKVSKILKSKFETDQNLTKEDLTKIGIAKYNEETGDFEFIYE